MAAELGSEVEEAEAAEMATVGLLALMLVVLGISLLAEVVTDVAGVGTADAELPPPLPLPPPPAAAAEEEEEEEEVEEEVEAGMPRRWSRACAMEVTWVLPQTRWWFSQSLCWQNEPQ